MIKIDRGSRVVQDAWHGNGYTRWRAGRAVHHAPTASFAEPPLLSSGQQGVGREGLRQVRREDLCEVLREEDGSAKYGTRRVFPMSTAGVLRGHRQRTRHRVASR